MSEFQKAVAILLGIALVVTAWMCRYSVVTASRGDGVAFAYKIDRWTGTVTALLAAQERSLVKTEPPQ